MLLFAVAVCFFGCSCASVEAQTRKLAFVVGVSEYQKTGLADLKYAHTDAEALSTELSKQGFEVTKFIAKDAMTKKVREGLKAFIEQTSELHKEDVVMVSFSGHGVQKMVKQDGRLVETPFVCLRDTLISKPETMISLNWVIEELKQNSGCNSNLLLVDACRNNPDKGARTLDGATVKELPTKISMLFSSSPGQKSYESEKVEQGVFTHVLLKGLQGEAKDRRGKISWLQLASYVQSELPYAVEELMESKDVLQRANLVGNLTSSALLAYPAADKAWAKLKAEEQRTADQYLAHARKYRGAKSEFDACWYALVNGNEEISAQATDYFAERFSDSPRTSWFLSYSLSRRLPTQKLLNFLTKLKENTSVDSISAEASLAEAGMFQKLYSIKTHLAFKLTESDKISQEAKTLLNAFSEEALFNRIRNILKSVSDSNAASISDSLKNRATEELFKLENLSIGKLAPDIEGVDLNGKKFKLSDYRGKVILLDFWADW